MKKITTIIFSLLALSCNEINENDKVAECVVVGKSADTDGIGGIVNTTFRVGVKLITDGSYETFVVHNRLYSVVERGDTLEIIMSSRNVLVKKINHSVWNEN
jgi:hypothetical protein